jgi:hypothetical protein
MNGKISLYISETGPGLSFLYDDPPSPFSVKEENHEDLKEVGISLQAELDAASLHHPHPQQQQQQQQHDAVSSPPSGGPHHSPADNSSSFTHKYYAHAHLGMKKWILFFYIAKYS